MKLNKEDQATVKYKARRHAEKYGGSEEQYIPLFTSNQKRRKVIKGAKFGGYSLATLLTIGSCEPMFCRKPVDAPAYEEVRKLELTAADLHSLKGDEDLLERFGITLEQPLDSIAADMWAHRDSLVETKEYKEDLNTSYQPTYASMKRVGLGVVLGLLTHLLGRGATALSRRKRRKDLAKLDAKEMPGYQYD